MPVIFQCFLADGHHDDISVCHLSVYQLKNATVITTGQASVTCNHDPTGALDLPLHHVRRENGVIQTGYIVDCLVEYLEIRTAALHPFLCTAQLRGSHQLHSTSDLHGALHTVDAQLYIFHGSGHLFPSQSVPIQIGRHRIR